MTTFYLCGQCEALYESPTGVTRCPDCRSPRVKVGTHSVDRVRTDAQRLN